VTLSIWRNINRPGANSLIQINGAAQLQAQVRELSAIPVAGTLERSRSNDARPSAEIILRRNCLQFTIDRFRHKGAMRSRSALNARSRALALGGGSGHQRTLADRARIKRASDDEHRFHETDRIGLPEMVGCAEVFLASGAESRCPAQKTTRPDMKPGRACVSTCRLIGGPTRGPQGGALRVTL
jgi:hypothetical protein